MQMSEDKIHPDDNRSIKKHIDFFGLPICIEILKGDTKYSKRHDGTIWSRTMDCDYGYFDGIVSDDGEFLDCYVVNDGANFHRVYAIEQYTTFAAGHKYDETKLIVGVNSMHEARELYLKHCQSPECMQFVTSLAIEDLVLWITGNLHVKN